MSPRPTRADDCSRYVSATVIKTPWLKPLREDTGHLASGGIGVYQGGEGSRIASDRNGGLSIKVGALISTSNTKPGKKLKATLAFLNSESLPQRYDSSSKATVPRTPPKVSVIWKQLLKHPCSAVGRHFHLTEFKTNVFFTSLVFDLLPSCLSLGSPSGFQNFFFCRDILTTVVKNRRDNTQYFIYF